MEESAGLLYFGTNLARIKSLDQTSFGKQKDRFRWSERTKLAQSRQKSYADNRRRELRFQVGDFVYLKVLPMRGLHRFKIRGEVAYQLELPPQLSDVHDVFHVSQLRKCLRVLKEQMPLEELTIGEDLTYEEYLVKILDTLEKVTIKAWMAHNSFGR
jgi:hypothetical protein